MTHIFYANMQHLKKNKNNNTNNYKILYNIRKYSSKELLSINSLNNDSTDLNHNTDISVEPTYNIE